MKNLQKLLNKSWCFLLILFLGLVVRLSGYLNNTFAFTYDVGRDLLLLQSMVTTHKVPLIGPTTGLHGLFYGPWWYYLLTPAFLIFRGDPRGIALFMVCIGVLTIYAGYAFGKNVSGRGFGLFFALFIAISQELIGLSIQIWNPNIAPLLVILVLIVLDKINTIKSKYSLIYFFFLGFILALIIDTEVIFGSLFFLSILISGIFFFRKKITIFGICEFLVGFLIEESPRILFEFRHSFLMTKTLFLVSKNTSANTIFSLNFDFVKRLSIFSNLWMSTLTGNNKIIGGIFFLLIAFIVFKFRNKFSQKERIFFLLSLITILTFFFGFTVFSQEIWSHYLVGIPMIYILFFIIPIRVLYREYKNDKKIFLLLIVVIFFVNLPPKRFADAFSKSAWVGDVSVYKNQLHVVDSVYKDAGGRQFKYVVYTPPVYDYTYQYLFSWYGKKSYGYLPDQTSHLFYLILEPDEQYPFRRTDWLKARENDGLTQREWILPGNITVQKRMSH